MSRVRRSQRRYAPSVASRQGSGSKGKRRAARALVATYYEAELAGLVEHVSDAIEGYRAGDLDVHDVDELIHRYTKAARELWKFCFLGGSGSHAERVAATLELLTAEGDRPDWWAAADLRRG
jgi:acetyl-CoA acetyltransferase